MRARVYIDGFNLYYRALKNTPHKWLDVAALADFVVGAATPWMARRFTSVVSTPFGREWVTELLYSRSRAVGMFTKDIKTFDDLFLHQLQDVYYAENQITKALPKMIAKATSAPLKQAFTTHLEETEGQIKRLDQVFALLDEKPKGATCPAIDGIIKEANEVASDIADKAVLNAALIASAQAVEHYEITRYGTLISWARQLGRDDMAALLKQTLDEEYATDDKLTQMAESRINKKAELETA